MTSTPLILHRGSGRKIKRNKLNRETLYYAVAFVLFSQHIAIHLGGKPRDWMTQVGQEAAALLLKSTENELDEWLTNWLLDITQNDTAHKSD
ncbi:hypothetical protein [Anabaena sp. PCC 7108]|uniref:hypothetical protein n=1 Tax=Anabaena sp. PCC 7108 TaxID=163908 RepID=UPI00034CA987|nr:hypothetical protein [Anabaena sp. PCC 7108]